jgi:type IV pilus assembly protein PilV
MVNARQRAAQRGATLIEVLITLVIIAFGLLGMAGLHVRMQVSEMEAYQRSQALMLLNEMATHIATNRANAAAYVTGASTPVGTNFDCNGMPSSTRAQIDMKAWCSELQGAAETTTSGGATLQQGAMIGARGCVELSADGDYLITVAWQGLTPIAAPPASVACGAGQYNSGVNCTNDLCRRTATTVVRIATLT